LEPSTHYPESVRQWLTSPLGDALVQQESRLVEEALDACSWVCGVNSTPF
jgi:hypothetical protein